MMRVDICIHIHIERERYIERQTERKRKGGRQREIESERVTHKGTQIEIAEEKRWTDRMTKESTICDVVPFLLPS